VPNEIVLPTVDGWSIQDKKFVSPLQRVVCYEKR